MHTLTQSEDRPIRLAAQPPRRIGPLAVTPALCQVGEGAAARHIEPRAMQVLVALAEGDGGAVSRDTLIARCWDGRIVGDNAINRVIAILRRLGAETGAFAIDTIPKVGYRLRAEVGPADRAPPEQTAAAAAPAPPVSRRWLLGLAAGGALAAVGLGPRLVRSGRDAARADALVTEAGLLLRDEDPRSDTARAMLAEAVRLAPGNARAWGLAAALEARSDSIWRRTTERTAKVRAAANRALALDPDQPDARLALIELAPLYRNWSDRESGLLAILRSHPDHVPTLAMLAELYFQTGRVAAGAVRMEAAHHAAPDSPAITSSTVMARWKTGRIDAMNRLAAAALREFGANAYVWNAAAYVFGLTGQPDRALGLYAGAAQLPDGPPGVGEAIAATFAALAGRGSREAAIAACLAAAQRRQSSASHTLPLLAALGDTASAWAIAERYYLNRGSFPVPYAYGARRPGPEEFRYRDTAQLFVPPTAPLRARPDFLALCADIGLVDYWRSGGRPDFLGNRPLPA